MKKRCLVLIVFMLILAMPVMVLAHSGRTDSEGGHKDNKNKSGLGNYHYHCGGNPPHLHGGGDCPYSSRTSATTSAPIKTAKDVISISGAPSTMKMGEHSVPEYRLTSDTDQTLSIFSNNPDVVQVGTSGTLQAVGEGEATITVSSQNSTETFRVVVKAILAESIQLSARNLALTVGESHKLIAAISPSDTSDPKVTWSSSDENIAVCQNGVIQGVSPGSAKITATTSNGLEVSAQIIVLEQQIETVPPATTEVTTEPAYIAVSSISLHTGKTSYMLNKDVNVGETLDITISIQPSNADDQTWTLHSSNSEVIRIEDNQPVIQGNGKAILTVSTPAGLSDQAEIQIEEEARQILAGVVGVAILGGGFFLYRKHKKAA